MKTTETNQVIQALKRRGVNERAALRGARDWRRPSLGIAQARRRSFASLSAEACDERPQGQARRPLQCSQGGS